VEEKVKKHEYPLKGDVAPEGLVFFGGSDRHRILSVPFKIGVSSTAVTGKKGHTDTDTDTLNSLTKEKDPH